MSTRQTSDIMISPILPLIADIHIRIMCYHDRFLMVVRSTSTNALTSITTNVVLFWYLRNVLGIIMFVIYLLQFGWVPQNILRIKLTTSIYRNYIIVPYVEGIIVIYRFYRKMLTHSRFTSWQLSLHK